VDWGRAERGRQGQGKRGIERGKMKRGREEQSEDGGDGQSENWVRGQNEEVEKEAE
jgi:hypothetical protein